MAGRLVRHSGVQKDVLHLYAAFFRALRAKPEQKESIAKYPVINNAFIFYYLVENKYLMKLILVRETFKEKAKAVDVRDVHTIESLLSRGRRQLQLLTMPGTDGYGVFTIKSSPEAPSSGTS